MKRVFSNSEVPHIFANQQQSDGRNSGQSIYFADDVLYSYGSHFPMAAFDLKDSNTVFFTTRGYSPSTGKHLNYSIQALSHKNLVYCYDPKEAREGNHTANINDFEARAKAQAMSLPRSRKPEMYLNSISRIRAQFEAYVSHCKVAKGKYKKLKFIHILTKDGGTEATAKERAQIIRDAKQAEKRRAQEAKKRIEKNKEEIEKFLNFETLRVYNRIDRDVLRYNLSNERFETSQGIEIPKIAAQRFYNWIKITLANGGCDGECTETIMDFQVSTVGEDVVKIGCHTIETKHMIETAEAVFGK